MNCAIAMAGAAVVGIVALLLAYGWLHALERRVERLERRIDEEIEAR